MHLQGLEIEGIGGIGDELSGLSKFLVSRLAGRGKCANHPIRVRRGHPVHARRLFAQG